MRDRSWDHAPTTFKRSTPPKTEAASKIDINFLDIGECKALILKLMEEAFYRQTELDAALAEAEQSNMKAAQFQHLAEEIGHSLVSVSEYARAASIKAKASDNRNGGTI